jgi:hypothetical protein
MLTPLPDTSSGESKLNPKGREQGRKEGRKEGRKGGEGKEKRRNERDGNGKKSIEKKERKGMEGTKRRTERWKERQEVYPFPLTLILHHLPSFLLQPLFPFPPLR